jgi:bacterioferritin (cytochrome b1)
MNLETILEHIVQDNALHAQWLNTLSLMENTGARKISASEHPTKVTLLILKHAAEESRHAYYLKKQILKLDGAGFEDYDFKSLIAPIRSYHYLKTLDVEASRYLKNEMGLSGYELSYAAYLMVTYAIEVRADDIYPKYQVALDNVNSKVNVKSIILEEEGHLEEMIAQLKLFDKDWEIHANVICELEHKLFNHWLKALYNEVKTVNIQEIVI